MKKRGWARRIWIAVLWAFLFSLLGCAAPSYVMIAGSSEFLRAEQLEAQRIRESIPPDLKKRLRKVVAESQAQAAPAKPAPQAAPAKPATPTQTVTRNKKTGEIVKAPEGAKPQQAQTQAEADIKGKPTSDGPKNVTQGEPPQLARGKRAHKEEPVLPGEKMEAPTPLGKRMDRYNSETGHIREIKPDNPRQIKAGEKQVEQYRKEMEKATGRPHTGEVSPYDPKNY